MTAYKSSGKREDMTSVGVWDGEGGMPENALLHQQFGRRIEIDRSWTVYHVFSGIPAHQAGQRMTGLTRMAATDEMLSLNRRRAQLRNGAAHGSDPHDIRTRSKDVVPGISQS